MSKGETARVFIAVELPDEVRARLGAISDRLRLDRDLKVVAPELLHITVKFLGPVPVERLPDVNAAADAAAGTSRPFALHLAGLGAFPGLRAPRVLWAGLREDAGMAQFTALFQGLEDELSVAGFARDTRPFSPHLTLARTRDNVSADARRSARELWGRMRDETDLNGVISVDALTVMRSDLRPTGPIYTPVHRAPCSMR